MNKIAFVLLLSLLYPLRSQASDKQKNPNIILIMCDDLGWGDTGFNGNVKIQTPNLDRMAGKGIVFNRFYSASAVCSPTRGSCLTGRNPYRYGIPGANKGHMKNEEITISELLKEKGYQTGHFGKWHLGTLTTKVHDSNRGKPGDATHYSIPTMHGYDTYFVSESKVPTYDPMIKPLVFDTSNGESLKYGWEAIKPGATSKKYGTYYWKGEEQAEDQNLEGSDSKLIMDRTISFIGNSLENDHPFLSVIWFHTPHLPVVASKKTMEAYSQYSHKEQIYYAAISAMDEQVGRLWEYLNQEGEADNTMIWFCSDNGPENDTPGSSGPFRERKRSLYEGGLRGPAFCVWPNGIKPGLQSDFPAVTSDYLPTIVDMLKISYPESRPLDGISLMKVVSGEAMEREKAIGFRFKSKMSWVTHRYKLISTNAGKNFELYDLLADKEEQKNIAAQHEKLVKQMKTDLYAWIKSCDNSAKGKDYK